MYQVTVVPQKRLIRFIVSGYSDTAEFERMWKEVRTAVGELNAEGGGFDVLSDLRQAHVIQTDNTEKTRQLMQWMMQNGLRKAANVTTSILIRMQLDRMAGDPRYGFFASEEEALQWLES